MAYKKQKNNKKILWGIGAVLFILLLVFSSQRFSLDDLQTDKPFGGATIFSIDTVQMQGRGVEDTQWVLALSMNDGAERVTGVFTKDDIARFNLNTVPASKFKVDFQLRNVGCQYDIQKEDVVLGKVYWALVKEYCLANVCPYDRVDLNDVINECVKQGGKNCERMVDLLQLGGSYTEWCYWTPEESNVPHPDSCHDKAIGQTITVTNTPAGCGRWRETTQKIEMRIDEGASGGDWEVQSVGIVPEWDVYRISSQAKLSYEAVVRVTIEDTKETFECVIDPITKVCELGDFGSVQFAGNLMADRSCPVPAVDERVIRNIDTKEWRSIDASVGSRYAYYVQNLEGMKEMDIDYYTFTAVPYEIISTQTTWNGAGCDPAVGNPIFPITTAMNGVYNRIPNDKPLFDFGCKVEDDNNYVCSDTSSVVYPLLKLTIKGSKVGIFTPDGQPKIMGVSTLSGRATQEGYSEQIKLDPARLTKLYVGIKNIGSEEDSFDVSIDCPFPLSQQSSRIPVSAGRIGIAELVVSGDGLIQSCNIRANSVSFPANRDEEKIDVIINPTCDQYGITRSNQIFTEFGCFAQPNYPLTPCNNNEFWLASLRKCIPYSNLATGEQRLEILEQVSKEDCSRQCNGNKECIVSCLEHGNVKPVCIGVGQMMTLNDFLCDFERQPNLMLPSTLQNKVWLDAPVCDYVCEWGYTGKDCLQVTNDLKFTYDMRPPTARLVSGTNKCETCFDGIKNQNEEGVDCGGICEEKYGAKFRCDNLKEPLHCFNHKVDGDEYCALNPAECMAKYGMLKPDCGGSCRFGCDDKYTEWNPAYVSKDQIKDNAIMFLIFVALILGVVSYLAYKKKKGVKRR